MDRGADCPLRAAKAWCRAVRAPLGGLVLWFGMAQTTFVPGGGHWTIRLAHLIIGVAAMGLSEALGAAVKRQRRALIARVASAAV